MNETYCAECSWPRCLSTDVCGICGRHFSESLPPDKDPYNQQFSPLPSAADNFWGRHGIHILITVSLFLGWLFLWRSLFRPLYVATALYFIVAGIWKWEQFNNSTVRLRIPVGLETITLSTIGVMMLYLCGPSGAKEIPPSPGIAAPLGVKETAPSPSIRIPSEYRILARHVQQGIEDGPEKFQKAKSSKAEIYAQIHTAILELEAIRTHDQQLQYVRDQAIALYHEIQQQAEKLESLPKPPAADQLFTESFILGAYSGFTGDPSGIALGLNSAMDADQKQAAILHAYSELATTFDKLQAIQNLLPKIAEQYATSPVTPGDRISIDLDATWGSANDNDWLYLYNSGATLTDCTIQVTLIGATGESRTLVHFVPNWSSQTWQYARYEPGFAVGERMVARSTVADIDKIGIRIWSPSFTTSTTYTYRGAARDEDIARYCQRIKLEASYQPFKTGVLWNTERSASFTMKGLSWIPAGRLTVTFRNGDTSRTYYQDFANWESGNSLTIQPRSGDLRSEADQLQVWLSFPNSNHHHRASFTVRR